MWSAIPRLAACLAGAFFFLSMSSQARADEIPLGSNGGLYTVPVLINGSVKIPFIVDSGATSVVIPQDVFETLIRSGTVSRSDVLGAARATQADGSTFETIRLRLREVRIGSHVAENVVATVTPRRADSLLGQTFLSRFGAVSFDYQRRILVLSGPHSVAVPSSSVTSVPMPSSAPFVDGAGSGRYGAFAHDDMSGKYGVSWNETDQAGADYNAVRGCNSAGCRVVFRTGPRQCGAIATTDDGKVWGGSTRPTKAGAEMAALQGCQKRTMLQCRVRGAECNR